MDTKELLINFKVYNQGTDLLGVADVELPSLEWMTETVSGAGIAGEVETSVLGHFKSLSLKLKWRTITEKATSLAKSMAHHLDLRGSIQRFDAAAGQVTTLPVKCMVKAVPKKVGLGKFATGKPQDNESEFECIYLKLWLDGKEKIEIDKYNYIAMVDEKDYLASVRKDLGIE